LQKRLDSPGVNRIIDANINRIKEGLRVCEEICRFILDSPKLTGDFKKLRHDVENAIKHLPDKLALVNERCSCKDVGKNIYVNELKRDCYKDIFFANIQRSKESVRVLEEFSKLINKKAAIEFKEIRYLLYEAEKKATKIILK